MRIIGVLGAVVCAGVLAGCGSSGSSVSSVIGGTGRTAVLLTDSPREDYGHVWATLYHVELIPQSGSAVVLYDNAAGTQIDLKTLRDASGQRFSFLSSSSIPAGTYTGVNVSIGTTMQVVRNGANVGNPLTVDTTLPLDASGHPLVNVTFKTAKTFGATSNTLILDFDLAHFIVKDSKVIPQIVDGSGEGLTDPARHNSNDTVGTISSLSGTSPTLTFTLTTGAGTAVTVVTTASTAIYGTGTLTNGNRVIVTGTLDATTQNLVATQILVCGAKNGGTPPVSDTTPRANGTASNLNAAAGTFTLTVTNVHNFTPTQTTVNVVTNSTTQYVADGGTTQTQAAFFSALATTPTVCVSGTYDSTTNTLTATILKVSDHSKDGGWEGGSHGFRDGINANNWGHGML